MAAIRCARLTTWTATPDGAHVQVGFENEAGARFAVSVPVDVRSALMMTIPRMLRHALKRRFADDSLRMIHQLGGWKIERAATGESAILILTTPDGFEVAFAIATPQADRLGTMLVQSAEELAEPAPLMN